MKIPLSSTAEEIIAELERRIAQNEVKDAVHKIKFMTARDVLKELIEWLNDFSFLNYYVNFYTWKLMLHLCEKYRFFQWNAT